MPLTEADVLRTARVLVEGCGEHAVTLASLYADKLLAEGRLQERTAWLRLKRAIEYLLVSGGPKEAPPN